MQLKIWIDDNNYAVVALKLAEAGVGEPAGFPEVVAASVVDSKLSDLKVDQLFELVGQVCDHLEARATAPAPRDDWREKFRRGEPI